MSTNARTKKELADENAALRLSEARYRALFERSRDAVFIAFEDGKVEINQAAVDVRRMGVTKVFAGETFDSLCAAALI